MPYFRSKLISLQPINLGSDNIGNKRTLTDPLSSNPVSVPSQRDFAVLVAHFRHGTGQRLSPATLTPS